MLDGVYGVFNLCGFYVECLGVDIYVMFVDGVLVCNIIEVVQNVYFDVEVVVGLLIVVGYVCFSFEECDLGVVLVEFGGEVINVLVYVGGMLLGLVLILMGLVDIIDLIVLVFGIWCFQVEWLKCVNGLVIVSLVDYCEMILVDVLGSEGCGEVVGLIVCYVDDKNCILCVELILVIIGQFG